MTNEEYQKAIQEVFWIEGLLCHPAHRKSTRLILRHMALCSAIHAHEAAQPRPLVVRTMHPERAS